MPCRVILGQLVVASIKLKQLPQQIFFILYMNFQNEEMETWLAQVELAAEKIKKLANNQITPQEIDRLQSVKAAQKERVQRGKAQLRKRQLEKLRLGHKGKGIRDFVSFCPYCHWQYGVQIAQCLHCKRKTMTPDQRKADLEVKVQEYKKKKRLHEQKRHKWKMWKKTQAMLWKKYSTNYSKWDNYTSSQDEVEEDKEPILPKNDPNFRALEADFQERKVRRDKQKKLAQRQKQLGNACMKQAKYQQAMQHYTMALEHMKDIKSIYTNRALAFIKLGKFKKAQSDCTRVVDYIQCFQKGFSQSPDLGYKALLRRALARKELRKYQEGLKDCQLAMSIYPKQQQIHQLKQQLVNFIKHEQSNRKLLQQANRQEQAKKEEEGQQQIELSQKQIIMEIAEMQQKQTPKEEPSPPEKQQKSQQKETEISSIKNHIQYLRSSLILDFQENTVKNILKILEINPDFKKAYVSMGAIKVLLTALIQKGKSTAPIIFELLQKTGVAQQEVLSFGTKRLWESLLIKIEQGQDGPAIQLIQILVGVTQSDIPRIKLSEHTSTLSFIQSSFGIIVKSFKQRADLASNYSILIGNLLNGQNQLKKKLQAKLQLFLQGLSLLLEHQSQSSKFIDLRKNCCNLLINILTNQQNRVAFVEHKQMLSAVIARTAVSPINLKYCGFIEALMGVWANLLTMTEKKVIEALDKTILGYSLLFKYLKHEQVNKQPEFQRIKQYSLKAISKLNCFSQLVDQIHFFYRFIGHEKPLESNCTSHALRIFINVLSTSPQTKLQVSRFNHLLQSKNEIIYCNSCLLIGMICEKDDVQSKLMKGQIKQLLQRVRTLTGNVRKSSAILLGKICREQGNRLLLKQLHGFQILQSVLQFVTK